MRSAGTQSTNESQGLAINEIVVEDKKMFKTTTTMIVRGEKHRTNIFYFHHQQHPKFLVQATTGDLFSIITLIIKISFRLI